MVPVVDAANAEAGFATRVRTLDEILAIPCVAAVRVRHRAALLEKIMRYSHQSPFIRFTKSR